MLETLELTHDHRELGEVCAVTQCRSTRLLGCEESLQNVCKIFDRVYWVNDYSNVLLLHHPGLLKNLGEY